MPPTWHNNPQRPAIPPVLSCALALWAGCLAAGECRTLDIPLADCILALALLVALGIVAYRRRKAALFVFLAMFMVLGFALFWASGTLLEAQRQQLCESPAQTYRFRVVEDPEQSSYGLSAVCEATPLADAGGFTQHTYTVRAYVKDSDLRYGDEFLATVTFSEPSAQGLATYDRKGWAARCSLGQVQDLESSGFGALSEVRAAYCSLVDSLAQANDWDVSATALLKALVVGDRTELFDLFLYQQVKVLGLSHLVAVSGAHLVIVQGFVRAGLEALRAPRRLAVCMQIVFLFLYLIMVGFPISCLRAALMAQVGLLSFSAGRRSHALSSLGVVIIAILALDHGAAYSVSFGLSALATLGIVLFAPLFASWAPLQNKRMRETLVMPAAMTLAALLFTFPVSVTVFSQFPVVSPLTNVLSAPLVTFVCGAGTLAFALQGVPHLSDLLLFAAYFCCCVFCGGASFFAGIPGVCIPVSADLSLCVLACLGIALCLWAAWPRRFPWRSVAALSFTLVVVIGAFGLVSAQRNQVVMLDVGQGDAFLVRSRGSALLIDTGNRPALLYSALARQGVYSLDGVLISHADDDHCGCLQDLAGIVSCRSVYVSEGTGDLAGSESKVDDLLSSAYALAGKDALVELSCGSTLSVGAFRLTMVSPSQLTDDGNEDSLCLLLESDLDDDGAYEWTMLFCGDAEAEVVGGLVEQGLIGKVDVYKVAHHGSAGALDEQLAQALDPLIALVSVGAGNSYGHPRAETLALLEAQGASVFRTDEDGDVSCEFTQTRIVVR